MIVSKNNKIIIYQVKQQGQYLKTLSTLLIGFIKLHTVLSWIKNIHNNRIHLIVECFYYVELKIWFEIISNGVFVRWILVSKEFKLPRNYLINKLQVFEL